MSWEEEHSDHKLHKLYQKWITQELLMSWEEEYGDHKLQTNLLKENLILTQYSPDKFVYQKPKDKASHLQPQSIIEGLVQI